jgi:hypothetical protein
VTTPPVVRRWSAIAGWGVLLVAGACANESAGPLAVDEPARPREEVLLLPKTLRNEGGRITYHHADAEEFRVALREGFFLGARTDAEGGDGMTMSLGGVPKPDDVNPIDAAHDPSQRLATAYTITVFETADAPGQMWHPGPGSGGYRELWRRRIVVDTDPAAVGSIEVLATTVYGAPLANAVVELVRLEVENPGHRSATTGADGAARFVGLRAGPYRVALREAPGVPESWMNSSGEDPQTSARIDVLGDEPATAALIAPRFAAFDVAMAEADVAEGVRPIIDVTHLYPGGTWSHGGHQTSWKADRPGNGRIVWHVTDAPEGRYRIRTCVKGHASSAIEVDVPASGDGVVIDVKPGPAVAPVELVYSGPALTRDHYFTMTRIDRTQQDTESGTFAGSPPSAVVTKASTGRYMLTLWRGGCALLLDVPESGARRFAVDVPDWTAPAAESGTASVGVVVAMGGRRVQPWMVAIAPASGDPMASGKWFRVADAIPGDFDCVPAGDWDVFVFDGVYGSWAGFHANPLVRRVHVGTEPVTVTFDL